MNIKRKAKVLLTLLAVLLVGYLVYKYYYLPSVAPGADVKPLNADDKITFERMKNTFGQMTGDWGALEWMLKDMRPSIADGKTFGLWHDTNNPAKSAAFLSVWAREYYGYGYGKDFGNNAEKEKMLNEALYEMFHKFRARYYINNGLVIPGMEDELNNAGIIV